MRHISLLIKPASSMCNMRCRYCFYADEAESRETASYGLMSEDTARRVLSAAASELKSGDCLSIAFQGGEPTLAGIDFFRSFFRMGDELLPGISLNWAFQTNGLVLDDAWCALLRERNVLVGLPVDGGAEIHNANRPDAAGKGTYARVHAAMECLRTHGVQFNILSVLTAGMARHPTAAWNWLKRERVDYVQFIPCLDRLEAETPSPYALTPARFQSFYRQLFPLWKKHLEEGGFVSVKFFDDLINLYLGGHATACGMTGRCAIQYVVEANGDVFPCKSTQFIGKEAVQRIPVFFRRESPEDRTQSLYSLAPLPVIRPIADVLDVRSEQIDDLLSVAVFLGREERIS